MIVQEVVDDVLHSFAKNRLSPLRHRFYDANRACAMGAIAIERGVSGVKVWNDLDKRYGDKFAEGILFGFDGFKTDNEGKSETYINGYETGCEIWRILNKGVNVE